MSVPAQLIIQESTAPFVSHCMCSTLAGTEKHMYFVYIAVCNPPCENGGRCVAPGVCSCAPEWEGLRCEQGKLNSCV